MFTGRRCGGTFAMSAPPIRMRPCCGVSNPAMRRINVVLPQPDGPSKAKNSPGAMSSDRLSTAVTAPKRLVTASSRMSGSREPNGRQPSLRSASSSRDCSTCGLVRTRPPRVFSNSPSLASADNSRVTCSRRQPIRAAMT